MVFIKSNSFNFIKFTLLICVSSCFLTCEKNPEVIYTYPGVDEPLHEYFRKFEEEGRKRGVKVDLVKAQIYGSLTTINVNSVVGVCDNNDHEVIIDKDFWATSSNMSKELIVFHELGHCYLKLPHTTNASEDGICKSIMRPGNGGCLDFYTSKTREKMLDELFR